MSVLKIKDGNGVWQDIPAIKGADGINGTDGVDGFSPTASVSKSGNVATISITDKNGTTTATISDGVDGTNGRDGYVQYTAGDNITIANNVISADVPQSLVYLSYTALSITQNDDSSTIISKLGGQSVLDSLLNAIANNNKLAICIGTDMTGQFGSLPITITSVRDNSTSERLIVLEFTLRGMMQDTAMPQIALVYNENSGTMMCIGIDAKYLAYKSDLSSYATQQYVNTAIANAIGNINTILATLTTPQGGE